VSLKTKFLLAIIPPTIIANVVVFIFSIAFNISISLSILDLSKN